MKNLIIVAVLAVALTGACLLLLREDQSGPDSEILDGSIHRVD